MKQEEKEREFVFKDSNLSHENADSNKMINGKKLIFCDLGTDLRAMVTPDISSDDDISMALFEEWQNEGLKNSNLFGKEIGDECGQDHHYLCALSIDDDREKEVVEKKKDMTLKDIMSYNKGCKICLEFAN